VNEQAIIGLLAVRIPLKDGDYSGVIPGTGRRQIYLRGQGLNRKVEGDTVTYSYYLKEFQDTNVRPSDKVLHSSSRCLGRAAVKGEVYERGKQIPRPTGGKFKSNLEFSNQPQDGWEKPIIRDIGLEGATNISQPNSVSGGFES
jgi:hypothetical protein